MGIDSRKVLVNSGASGLLAFQATQFYRRYLTYHKKNIYRIQISASIRSGPAYFL